MICARGRPLLTIAEARRRVLDAVRPLAPEPVPVAGALGRVLAEDVIAATDVPPFANSAMDGFAVAAGPAGRTLRVTLESRAGHPADGTVGEGEACRISTGAAMPAGADAVVPVERTSEADGAVTLEIDAAPGMHVRDAGEDLRAGALVLAAGTRAARPASSACSSAPAAARSSAARARASPSSRPATSCGRPARRSAPARSTSPTSSPSARWRPRRARASRSPATCRTGRDGDRSDAIAEALDAVDVRDRSRAACRSGPHDHVKGALRELRRRGASSGAWRSSPASRRGSARAAGTLVFGLPGNPVSAMVTFILFARAALRALQGERARRAGRPRAARRAGDARRRRASRRVRVRLERRADGLLAMVDRAAGVAPDELDGRAPTRWRSSPAARARSRPGRRRAGGAAVAMTIVPDRPRGVRADRAGADRRRSSCAARRRVADVVIDHSDDRPWSARTARCARCRPPI